MNRLTSSPQFSTNPAALAGFRKTLTGHSAALLLLCCLANVPAYSQSNASEPSSSPAPVSSERRAVSSRAISDDERGAVESPESGSIEGLRTRDLPAGSFGEQPAGVPYRSMFRDTGAPYTQSLRGSPLSEPLKVGEVEGRGSITIPHFRLETPALRRAVEPEEADLKLGPVYIRIGSVSAGLVLSDNVNLSEHDRESGAIAIVRTGVAVAVQLTEGFQFNLAGSAAWLPLQGTAGVNGLGVGASFLAATDYAPLVQGQFVYETMIAGWPVVFADDFNLNTGSWVESTRDDFWAFEGFEYTDEDRAGRYAFRDRIFNTTDQDRADRSQDLNADIVYFNNGVSATTQKDLPNAIHFRAGVYHDNFFYFENSDRADHLASRRDVVSLYAASVRENLRFKPYASYRFINVDVNEGSQHIFRTGVSGPITDQLFLNTNAGVLYDSGRDRLHGLWNLTLQHVAGPYTHQSLSTSRSYDDLNDVLVDHVGYWLDQVLGKNLSGQFFVSKAWYSDLDESGADYSIFRTGLRFTHFISPKTQVRLSGIYSHYDSNAFDADTYTARFELSRHITDTLTSRLLYQFQKRESDRAGQSYYENAVFVNVTKYFP